MAGFVFRLQKVLEHRMRLEDEKKQAFVKSRQEYLKELDVLNTLKDKLDECLSCGWKNSMNIFSYISKQNYIVFMEDNIEDQEKRLSVLETIMERKKTEFNESQKNRKVLEKLKEKAYKEYMQEQDRVEQQQNDEFALYGYTRK
ncbi:flagellar biosynthesis chaperone [Oxobacter pfennigii]|uniref:Flagellar FliJ protein n=1 Tax=Oxobacter pfennigii TaxID=36849 RepID=A0A0P8YY54_9CLOT|nr:flagellar export protein FliJ [Oxobacter pfennigii]KPU44691.1 flagellar biosynthesis chaperone [Oxobacter pfennigii]